MPIIISFVKMKRVNESIVLLYLFVLASNLIDMIILIKKKFELINFATFFFYILICLIKVIRKIKF